MLKMYGHLQEEHQTQNRVEQGRVYLDHTAVVEAGCPMDEKK